MGNQSKKIISTNNSLISTNNSKTFGIEIEVSTNPVINPSLIEDTESGFFLYNTKPTNALGFKKKFKGTDIIKGKIKISIDKGDGELIIENRDKKYNEKDYHKIFVNSTTKLFRYITLKLTEQTFGKEINPKEIVEVLINIADYQKLTDRKDYNNVGKQIEKDLEILYRCSIKYEKINRKVKGESIPFMQSLDTRILVAKGKKKRGTFNVALVPGLVSYLIESNQRMKLHPYYFRATPVASELLDFFELQKRIKYKKPQNTTKMKFKTIILLKAIGSLPHYEYVMKHNDGHIGRKIIAPFQNALEELEEKKVMGWEYCNKKGIPLTDEQLGISKGKKQTKTELDWKVFSKIYIQVELHI
jgi:hypothetical protein